MIDAALREKEYVWYLQVQYREMTVMKIMVEKVLSFR